MKIPHLKNSINISIELKNFLSIGGEGDGGQTFLEMTYNARIKKKKRRKKERKKKERKKNVRTIERKPVQKNARSKRRAPFVLTDTPNIRRIEVAVFWRWFHPSTSPATPSGG